MLTLGQAIDRRFVHDDPWAHDALAALGDSERDDEVHDVAKGWLRIGGESGTLVDALFVLTASRIGFSQTSHDGVPPQWIPLRSIVALDAIEGVPYPLVTVEVQLSGDVAILVGWPDAFCGEVVEVLTADLAAAARQSAPAVEPETMPQDFADPASTANAADPAALDELEPSAWQEQDLAEPAPGAWSPTPEFAGTPAAATASSASCGGAGGTRRPDAARRTVRRRQRDGILRPRRRRAARHPVLPRRGTVGRGLVAHAARVGGAGRRAHDPRVVPIPEPSRAPVDRAGLDLDPARDERAGLDRARVADVRHDPERPGPLRGDLLRADPVRSDPVRFDPVRPEPVRPAPGRLAPVRRAWNRRPRRRRTSSPRRPPSSRRRTPRSTSAPTRSSPTSTSSRSRRSPRSPRSHPSTRRPRRRAG